MADKCDRYFCGKCKKDYKTKHNWILHHNAELVYASTAKTGQPGKVPNICYQSTDPRICAKTLTKAVHDFNRAVKDKENGDRIFKAFKRPGFASSASICEESSKKAKLDHNVPLPSTPVATSGSLSQLSNVVKPSDSMPSISVEPKKDAETQTHAQNFNTNNGNTQTTACPQTLEILKLVKEIHKVSNESVINKSNMVRVDQRLNEKSVSKNCKLEDDKFQTNIILIKNAKSIKSILENDLLSSFQLKSKAQSNTNMNEDVDVIELPEEVVCHFAESNVCLPGIDSVDVEEDQESNFNGTNHDQPEEQRLNCEKYTLDCMPCTNKKSPGHIHTGVIQIGKFVVDDPDYVVQKGQNQKKWFGNLKRSLTRHLVKLEHHQRQAVYELMKVQRRQEAGKIHNLCTNILYFIMKTNTAWSLYPVLLGCLYRSGCQIGNINHSRWTCETFLPILDDELKKESSDWFSAQKSVTVTADVGVINGLEILVVLLISEVLSV